MTTLILSHRIDDFKINFLFSKAASYLLIIILLLITLCRAISLFKQTFNLNAIRKELMQWKIFATIIFIFTLMFLINALFLIVKNCNILHLNESSSSFLIYKTLNTLFSKTNMYITVISISLSRVQLQSSVRTSSRSESLLAIK